MPELTLGQVVNLATFVLLMVNGYLDRKNAKVAQEKIEGVHVLVNSEAEKQRKVVAALQATIAALLKDKADRSGNPDDATRATIALEQIAEAQIAGLQSAPAPVKPEK